MVNKYMAAGVVAAALVGAAGTAHAGKDLDAVKARGQLICGVNTGIAGFAPDAAKHFYLPERYTDPFGNVTTVQFDHHDLFVESSTDALGNVTLVERGRHPVAHHDHHADARHRAGLRLHRHQLL